MSEVIVGKYAEFGGLILQLRSTPTGRYAVDLFEGDRCVFTSGPDHAMEESNAEDRAMQFFRKHRRSHPGPEPESESSGSRWPPRSFVSALKYSISKVPRIILSSSNKAWCSHFLVTSNNT